jgi:methylated-DNA-[protein]-cysteine S-methyltransferase
LADQTSGDIGGGTVAVALSSIDTPVGPVLVAATEAGLSGVSFGDSPRWRDRMTFALRLVDAPELTAPAIERLTAYFAGTRDDFDLPIDWRHVSSRLAQETLEILFTSVPYGATVTYGELAARVSERRGGNPVPARAIGGVMGSNPVPIVVPCHRVVAGNGLGGFSGGSGPEVKRRLLTHEGVLPPTLDFGDLGL